MSPQNNQNNKLNSNNLNYVFNVEYFEEIDFLDPKSKENDKLINGYTDSNEQYHPGLDYYVLNKTCQEPPSIALYDGIANKTIELFTTYPGLVAGVGSAHEFGGNGEFSLGFTTDYVTGVPYIPGSSVKGALKSSFKYEEFIKSFLPDRIKEVNIKKLCCSIFEDENYDSQNKPFRDIFFDAYPSWENTGKKILADDYITPHKSAIKNPKPIRFLKVRPNVKFVFAFNLHNVIIDDLTITAEDKRTLFKSLLTSVGVGAKTNVGYGAFSESSSQISREVHTQATNTNAGCGQNNSNRNNNPGNNSNRNNSNQGYNNRKR